MPTRPKDFDRCPSNEALMEFALGKLPQAEMVAVAQRLDTCEHCQSNLESLGDVSDAVVDGLRQPVTDEPYLKESGYLDMMEQMEAIGHGGATSLAPAPQGSAWEKEEEDLPRRLGQYRLLERLGSGGMGTVYKALHLKLEKLVALKVLPRDRMKDAQSVTRFLREIKAVGKLDHPNIVRATDAGEAAR